MEAEAGEDNEPEEPPKILGPPSGDPPPAEAQPTEGKQGPVPVARVAPRKFKIMYTCGVCEHRNSHMISRVAYTQGIVIATCQGCGSRHLLSDKTGLLDYGLWDVEMLAKDGVSVTRLGGEGYRAVSGSESADAAAATIAGKSTDTNAKSQLLVNNKDGVIEALPEEDVGIGGAAAFLAEGVGDGEADGP